MATKIEVRTGNAAAFGAAVKARRLRLGLTLVQLAERVAKHYPHLSAIENGRVIPEVATVLALEKALEFGPGKLFSKFY